ncbi:MAG: HD domain-containing protein [Clostridiales bacterium]
MLTFEQIKNDACINTYIRMADQALVALGFTEHSFAHVAKVADTAKYILETMGFPERDVELAQIAGYLHDIGNLVNRADHAQSGALMAFHILNNMNADAEDIALIVSAIGNHDEATAVVVNPIAAALILADKTDVRRSRVRNTNAGVTDIHDRVNYSVISSEITIDKERTYIQLQLTVETQYSSVMDYFEIFLVRMILCRKAAEALGLQFKLVINDQALL